jgi:membrane-associated protease RseP (regulator of RpoE activity)
VSQIDPLAALRRAADQVMAIEEVVVDDKQSPLTVRGRLLMPSEQAFKILREQYESVGYTPLLRREGERDVIAALPQVFAPATPSAWLNVVLLGLTLLSVLFTGATYGIESLTLPDLIGNAGTGLSYALALIGILGAHEMGHYLMARRHGVQTTLPYFIPMPFNILGTLGAVIAMREPAPNRRVQFDIGIAGPLAGLVVAVPVVIVGLMTSRVGPLPTQPYYLEGNSIFYYLLKFVIFGEFLPNATRDVSINAVAFAAWAGLLVTALNLLPVGQLDGGHVMYGLFGDKARLARWPVVGLLVLLAAAGSLGLPFGWEGWGLWAVLILFLMRSHAPVLDEITPLDPARKLLGVALLIIFVLLFVPAPLTIVNPAGVGGPTL